MTLIYYYNSSESEFQSGDSDFQFDDDGMADDGKTDDGGMTSYDDMTDDEEYTEGSGVELLETISIERQSTPSDNSSHSKHGPYTILFIFSFVFIYY